MVAPPDNGSGAHLEINSGQQLLRVSPLTLIKIQKNFIFVSTLAKFNLRK